ncbi:protein of unknown function DUF1680 [Leadbetterella byssophila DSM 17132]|uniref:LamG-like jellyroll fold domain-containing protein n=1 Tax=Leadbetterella byssophila (strain DSM 17132 / JCM 16389 / KACC 11308 / NBRC 106382 / 4M15) TaxID=649349 RepID=E4RWI5_LEAB4|nr:beta-L-arabinofuranosidase domain-containing protein [Leadbetterella byssophila]ADQ18925.1 protein of unknown function DUF1680 [Leadbetterella byssophila DSM 17132]
MYKIVLGICAFLMVCSKPLQAQDQILDGIGETAMIARYIFNGDTRDWSRNNHHAKVEGGQARFIDDARFKKVIALSGGSYVTLPSETLSDLESISISAWVNIKSKEEGQRLFAFGKDANKQFSAAPTGLKGQDGFHALFTAGSSKPASSTAIELNKWVHVVVVVDITSKTLTTYLDNKALAEVSGIPQELDAVLGQTNTLYIGKSLTGGDPTLNALVHDFRIYRVPLTRRQVAGIYFGANKSQEGAVNVGKPEENLPQFGKEESQLYHKYLVKVSDITVETEVGNLPRLPSHVPAQYSNGLKLDKVRVIWPAPTDNSSVLEPGKYTISGKIAGSDFVPKATVIVKADKKVTPKAKLAAFPLSAVTLEADRHQHDTKFIENRDKFIQGLAKTDPNSFLYMFRHAFGQKQPEGAKPLGVWDSQNTKLRGHATGHYLTAIAQAYASTGYDKNLQANFAGKMDQLVNTLYELSRLSGTPKVQGGEAVADPTKVPMGPGKTEYDSDLTDEGIRTDYWNWGKGYISAYPPDQFIMLEQGAKYGGQKNQVWAPYYTLHKILAGLMDVYEVSGNKKALDVAVGMSEWVHARLAALPQDTLIKMWNTYIAGEYGGMNESMARLFFLTKNEKFLKTAQLFDNIKMFYGDASHSHGLARNVDTFRGLHANQHIPQIVGSIEMYAVSQNPDYYFIAENFWHRTVSDYMYSIGGVAGARNPANAECFIAQPATIYENGFSQGGQNETCATYNMLKLTSSLFMFDQKAEYMDYYERGLYNHILASVAKDSPANTYHVPLRPGSIKQFGNPNMTGFTCCNGTAIESNTKLQNSIYFKSLDNSTLYVNLFIPSTLNWEEKGIKVVQTTSFPKEDQTKLRIEGNGKFDLQVRVPGWAKKGFVVKINGKKQKIKATPGSYAKISRTWKNGDVLEITMPFEFHLDYVMDQPNIASLFYGPVLLAAQETEARKEWRQVTFDAKDLSKNIKGNPETLEFTIDGVQFKPFYESYGRHSVYLDVRLK